jgi:hypothetical protein
MKRHALTAGYAVFAGTVVVLLARSIAYALSPSPAALVFEHKAGGPGLPVLTLVALTLGGTIAIIICWLAAFGVRERALVERRPAPRLRLLRPLVFGVLLAVSTSLLGGLFEAYLHWRAGLGWHGLHCVFGPVHRDLWPIATALSFVAAALLAAAEHLVAWMRRTFALLRRLPPRLGATFVLAVPCVDLPSTLRRTFAARPRAPPALS